MQQSVLEKSLLKVIWPQIKTEIERIGYEAAALRLDVAVPGVKTLLWATVNLRLERTLTILELLGMPAKQILQDALDSL
jgi:hypothetical protein